MDVDFSRGLENEQTSFDERHPLFSLGNTDDFLEGKNCDWFLEDFIFLVAVSKLKGL